MESKSQWARVQTKVKNLIKKINRKTKVKNLVLWLGCPIILWPCWQWQMGHHQLKNGPFFLSEKVTHSFGLHVLCLLNRSTYSNNKYFLPYKHGESYGNVVNMPIKLKQLGIFLLFGSETENFKLVIGIERQQLVPTN